MKVRAQEFLNSVVLCALLLFSGNTANGAHKKISDFRGHPILLHFWASWCTTCKEEIPSLQKLIEHTQTNAPIFLPVSVDSEKDKIAAEHFLKMNAPAVPFITAVDARSIQKYWSWGIPVTYFIDANGKITSRALGRREWKSLP
jgi:thiol-disulfide isomerase/thioredoxin